MSSLPFNLGLSVVDRLEPIDGSVVLRTVNANEMIDEVHRIQNELSSTDVIKVTPIGMRPDQPIPIAMHFAEICIRKNCEVKEWMTPYGISIFDQGLWKYIFTGKLKM